jgi:hypothetical protein
VETVGGRVRIADILRDRNNWKRYLAWEDSLGQAVHSAERWNVARLLVCATAALGASLYRCAECGTLRVVPHSCKSRFCISCGTARTRDWCERLLSELLAVPYRHPIFTIPWQLRLLIKDNRRRLEGALFRVAADSVLALTRGDPKPMGRKGRGRLKHQRKRYLPGMLIALHTFGSDIKWNPHWHMMVTAGGLALDGLRWFSAPSRSLVSTVELATEWRLPGRRLKQRSKPQPKAASLVPPQVPGRREAAPALSQVRQEHGLLRRALRQPRGHRHHAGDRPPPTTGSLIPPS